MNMFYVYVRCREILTKSTWPHWTCLLENDVRQRRQSPAFCSIHSDRKCANFYGERHELDVRSKQWALFAYNTA